jgi:hypothetical protein
VSIGSEFQHGLTPRLDHQLYITAQPLSHPLVEPHPQRLGNTELVGKRDLPPRAMHNLAQRLLGLLLILLLIQLESWEAALKSGFAPESSEKSPQVIDIAKLLGWIKFHSRNQSAQLNDTARACHAAYAAIQSPSYCRSDQDHDPPAA